MTPLRSSHLDTSLSERSLVDRIIEDFLDSWVMHAYLLPTNSTRNSFRAETVLKFQRLIQTIENLNFEQFSLVEWDILDSIDEEKTAD